MMRARRSVVLLAALALLTGAGSDGFQLIEVPSLMAAAGLHELHVIAFNDHRRDELADPATGLITFENWARVMPAEKQLLSPYPAYAEPTRNLTVNGIAKAVHEKLHMYVAEARFLLPRPPQALVLEPTLIDHWLTQIDPAISHRPLPAAEADNSSNPNPDRRWCEGRPNLLCFQSHYELEGKLPMAIHLLNKLVENKKKIADYLEFQSEVEILGAADVDAKRLSLLTGSTAVITGGFQQTIFHVNQILQFGKVLCVFQQDTSESSRTAVTVFIVLAIKTRVLEKQKKYESVPVLRNLIPSQLLVGNSSFNSGSSLSAGLPKYARNQVRAMATLLQRE